MDKERIQAWALAKMQFAAESPLESGYRYYHGQRTGHLALSLADGMGLAVDRDVAFIGALLHDVGKATCSGLGHGAQGAEIIRAEIADLFTVKELDAVCNVVANHYHRPNSRYYVGLPKPVFPTEVLLVQDADTLDHFGANAVWLAMHWATAEDLTEQQSIEYYRNEASKWREEARQGLNFALSRHELKARIAYADAFFARLEDEGAGKLRCDANVSHSNRRVVQKIRGSSRP